MQYRRGSRGAQHSLCGVVTPAAPNADDSSHASREPTVRDVTCMRGSSRAGFSGGSWGIQHRDHRVMHALCSSLTWRPASHVRGPRRIPRGFAGAPGWPKRKRPRSWGWGLEEGIGAIRVLRPSEVVYRQPRERGLAVAEVSRGKRGGEPTPAQRLAFLQSDFGLVPNVDGRHSMNFF